GDLDLPTVQLEPIVHEASAVHRLDRGTDRLGVSSDALAQVMQSISVRWSRAALDRRTLSIEQVKVETLATEIQAGVQHCVGLPSSYEDARSMTPREALLHGSPYHEREEGADLRGVCAQRSRYSSLAGRRASSRFAWPCDPSATSCEA